MWSRVSLRVWVFWTERVLVLRRTLPTTQKQSFDQSLEHIKRYVNENARDPSYPRDRRVCTQCGGSLPFVYAIFSARVQPTRRGFSPHIFQLMALKNTYDRYVVVIMNKDRASILEVNLGTITRQTWSEHSVSPDRIEREWSKERYQRHRHKQTEETIREKIKTLDGLMGTGAHSHLMLAGEPPMVERLKAGLPSHLRQKLVDTVHAKAADNLADIVTATLSSFVDYQQQHSHTCVAMLQQAVYTNGLGILGTDASLECLRYARADMLILAEEYDPGPAWQCRECGDAQIGRDSPQACPECSSTKFRRFFVKEEMVRMAEGSSCGVKVVKGSDFLIAGGGVGCLTRY